MKIKPLSDHLVVEPFEEEEKTASGIVIPDTAKEKPQKGKVLAVGPGKYEEGKRIPLDVKVGDTVLYKKYGLTDFKFEGKELLIGEVSDILAVVEG